MFTLTTFIGKEGRSWNQSERPRILPQNFCGGFKYFEVKSSVRHVACFNNETDVTETLSRRGRQLRSRMNMELDFRAQVALVNHSSLKLNRATLFRDVIGIFKYFFPSSPKVRVRKRIRYVWATRRALYHVHMTPSGGKSSPGPFMPTGPGVSLSYSNNSLRRHSSPAAIISTHTSDYKQIVRAAFASMVE